ncbi:hypothetical protein D3C72_2276800 [compost metagenome]
MRNEPLASVVDQQIYAAEACSHLGGKLRYLRLIQHVAAQCQDLRLRKLMAQAGFGTGQFVRIAAAKCHLRAFRQQQTQGFETDARRTAGDHRDPFLKLKIHG